MQIAVVQLSTFAGDVSRNVKKHAQFIEAAVADGATLILFPELSLTGYEPALAAGLAFDSADNRLAPLQMLSNIYQVAIAVGIPLQLGETLHIALALLRPNTPPHFYTKQFLHPDEDAYFCAGQSTPVVTIEGMSIALAICYELFVDDHTRAVAMTGAHLYIASVAKSADGMRRAVHRAPVIATEHNMPVLLVNCVGSADNFIGAGQSAVWLQDGSLVAQMGAYTEGYLLFDPMTQQATIKKFA